MNQLIPSICALALLAGGAWAQDACCSSRVVKVRCAIPVQVTPCDDPYIPPLRGVNVSCCQDIYRSPYMIRYPRLCPTTTDLVPVGNTVHALAIRRTAILRQRANVAFEREMLAASTPITQPANTGTVIFGETEGAGVFESGQGCPPPAPPYPGPSCSGKVMQVIKRGPAAVGEQVLIGTPVPGKPGYCYSPYVRTQGFIDIRGMNSGSLAKDPYCGRTFRVP